MPSLKDYIRFYKSESARKKITKEQLKEINKLYNDLYNQIKKEAKEVAKKKNYSAGMQKLYLDSFAKRLKNEMNRINEMSGDIVKNGSLKMAEQVVKENESFLKSLGLEIHGAYSYVPTKAVAQIINGNVYNGKWTLSRAIWGSNQKDIKNIERIIAEGTAGNKPTAKIAKDLLQYSKSGKSKYNAMRLARTMTNHAYQKAFQMTTEKNPFIEAYQWNNGHADTDVCDLCKELAETDGFGLGPGVFPKGEVPMDHPNGYCFITAITMSREQIDNALIDWVNDTGDSIMNNALDDFAKDMGFLPITVKGAVKGVNAATTLNDVKNFKDLEQVLKSIYGESFVIDESIKNLNIEAVKDTLAGFDEVLSKYNARGYFKKLSSDNVGAANYDFYGVLSINKKIFNIKNYDDVLENMLTAKDLSRNLPDLGKHEAGHLLTEAFCRLNGYKVRTNERVQCARDIINEAKRIAKSKDGLTHKIDGISRYAGKDNFEAIAEAVLASTFENRDKYKRIDWVLVDAIMEVLTKGILK